MKVCCWFKKKENVTNLKTNQISFPNDSLITILNSIRWGLIFGDENLRKKIIQILCFD